MWLAKSVKLKLKLRSLIAMKCSLISYMGLGYEEQTDVLMMQLKQVSLDQCAKFVPLWFNLYLYCAQAQILFEKEAS